MAKDKNILVDQVESCDAVPVGKKLTDLAGKAARTCQQNIANVLGGLMVAISSPVMAEPPTQLASVSILSTPSTSANASADKNISGQIPRKIDGSIDFASWLAGKGPEERKQMMKRLSRDEKEAFAEYMENEGKNLDTALIEKEEKGKRLDFENEGKKTALIATSIIEGMGKKMQGGGKLSNNDKDALLSAGKTPGIPEGARSLAKYLLSL